jgi:DNA-directed RNA polymerase subunit RPC12/RpoP
MDITTAEGQCGNCGAKRLFAEAHLYLQCPGLVARCPLCGHVLLRLANIQERVFLDLRGMTNLTFDTAQESNVIS